MLSISVRDSITKAPVGYASLKAKVGSFYGDCDEDGNGSIRAFATDTIEISRVGYFKKYIIADPNSAHLDVFLAVRVDTLPTVDIRPLGKAWSFSSFDSKNCRSVNFSNDTVLSEVAARVVLPADAKGIVLSTISFKQRNFVNAFIRLHVYRVNEIGLPGEDLLSEVLVVTESHFSNGVVSIPISNMNILVQENEFFVGLQWLTKKEPKAEGRKNDVGIAETCSLKTAFTYYKNFGLGRNWHQSFSNGVRVYLEKSGAKVERLFAQNEPIGVPFNLMLAVEGRLL